MNKKAILEGILFISGSDGLDINTIASVLETDKADALTVLKELQEEYNQDNHGIQISVLGNNYKFITKPIYNDYNKKLITDNEENTLSDSALETLAIIAYNSPVTRGEISEIRGVDSTYVVRKLELRGLIESTGRSDAPGHPMQYAVTNNFLDYFGLSSLAELPKLSDAEENTDETDLFESKYKEDSTNN